jgi:hypothetical protein
MINQSSGYSPVIGEESFRYPAHSFAARGLVGFGDYLEDDISKTASENIPVKATFKTPRVKNANKTTLNNAASHPTFKARSAKIRKDQMDLYNKALERNVSHRKFSEDEDAQFRVAKSLVKKFLRV